MQEPLATHAGRATLPKPKRLAKRAEFVRVYESGQKLFSRFAVVFFAGNGLGHSRLGITATKKLGKAHVRNRLKRWTREVYRRVREPIEIDARALDVVVNVKPGAAETSFQEYERDLRRLLERVVRDSGRQAS